MDKKAIEILNNQIRQDWIENPLQTIPDMVDKYKCSRDKIKNIQASLQQKKLIPNYKDVLKKLSENDLYKVKNNTLVEENSTKIDSEKGTLESIRELSFEPKNDIELAKLHNIDLTKYKISTYWSKLKSNGKFTSSVLCTLRKLNNDLPLQKDFLLSEIKEYYESTTWLNNFKFFSNQIRLDNKLNIKTGDKLLEISIPDLHWGKMSHEEESGEDYDIKIAEKRYKDAIKNLLKLSNLDEVSTILLPIGNDLFNVDNQFSTTTGGTPQDCDTRFHKMVKTVKELLINTITGLSALAKVEILIVPGNHDEITTFMLGEILEAFFHSNDNVNINNGAKLRKYYQYGKNSFLYTHGDKEKHGDLGLIFATEEPQLWADTKYRFVKLGHLHKQKKIEYMTTDSKQGFQIEVLPSLSGSDKWHYGKGYIGNKQAKAYLYDKEMGEIAQYTYTV